MGFFESGKERRAKQHEYDVDMLNREQYFNAQQAQIAYNREREFYDYQFEKESEYNSPAAQMQRYQAAGLNPYLMSLDSGNTSVSSSSVPAASASGSNTVNTEAGQNNTLAALSNIAGIAQGMTQLQSQTDLNKSQEVKNYAESAKTSGVDTEEVKANIKKIMQDTATSKSQESNINSDTELKDYQKKNIAEDTRKLAYEVDKLLPAQLSEISKRIEDLASQILQRQQVTPAEIAKLRQDVLESIQRVNLNSRQESYLMKQIDSYDSELAARLNISNEQFQQLTTKNATLKLRNQLIDDILTFDHTKDNFMDTKFRDRIYRLRALMTLDPEVKWQFVRDPHSKGFWHTDKSFDFGF